MSEYEKSQVISDLKPNSHKAKSEEAKREQRKPKSVINGSAKVKKKGELAKLADIFLPEDVTDVKSYLLRDVLVPAAKKLVDDLVTGGVHMFLYGNASRGHSSGGRTTNYVSYSRYSDPRDNKPRANTRGIDYDDLCFENRGDAELVLDTMCDMLDRYDQVSILDMYDTAGMSCPHTWNSYGWTNLSTAQVVRSRDGWIIKLPRAVPLK